MGNCSCLLMLIMEIIMLLDCMIYYNKIKTKFSIFNNNNYEIEEVMELYYYDIFFIVSK